MGFFSEYALGRDSEGYERLAGTRMFKMYQTVNGCYNSNPFFHWEQEGVELEDAIEFYMARGHGQMVDNIMTMKEMKSLGITATEAESRVDWVLV